MTNDLFQVVPLAATAAVSHRLQRVRSQLTARDLAILHTLAALRLATTRQIERLHYATGSPRTRAPRARRTLQRLRSHGLVARLDRRVGGPDAGSSGHVYHLTPDGYRLAGARVTRLERFVRTRDHTLAVSELAVTLYEAHRAGALELVRFETEPVSWRTYTHNGTRRYVRPDAFTIVAAGAWEHLSFVELDQGTQTIATVVRKAHAYRAYATAGHEQTRWGVFPRVAYLTTTPTRRDALAHALAATPDADALVTVALQTDAPAALTPQPEGDQP